MLLKIVSTLKTEQFDIEWIELNTPVGNFLIQDQHAPMILTLSKQSEVNFLLKTGMQDTFIAPQGIAHIERNSVTVLLI